jgi:hypothetical protein
MWDGKLILSVHHLALNFLEDVHPQLLDARGEALSLMLSIIRCFHAIGTERFPSPARNRQAKRRW